MKFEVGKSYATPSICDHAMMVSIEVESRTKCFITSSEGKKFKVSICPTGSNEGAEMVWPWGKYSMCPIITANDVEEEVDGMFHVNASKRLCRSAE
jgi:hypothetical protein